jgi:group I intron endonuclease
MSIGIYRIVNKVNGKSYVGQSVNIEKRLKTHFWAAFKEHLPSYNYHIYQAIRKYGKENFETEILETIPNIDIEKLNELEIKYIKQFNSYEKGYNMNTGGDNSEQSLKSGENNGRAKLTEADVIDIRERYNNHQLKREVYELYKNKVGKSGFHKIWNWQTWPTVLPEYHSPENIKWHSSAGRALPSDIAALNAGKISKETIYSIRELCAEGMTNEEIVELLELPILAEEVRRIRTGERFGSV